MGKVIDLLKKKKILLSDGAWGTMMQRKGLKAGECPELWNTERADDIIDIAHLYINAGSDMIKTNSFGGNRLRLKHFGIAEKSEELNKLSAEIARKAAGNNTIVLGSMGPSGKMMMMNEVTEDELYEAYAAQSAALERGGADAILIETFTATDEAMVAINAVKENTNLEIICTFTFDKTPAGTYRTMMGTNTAQMAEAVTEADIIGTNCGNGIENMVEIVGELKKVSAGKPIIVHSNAGMPLIKDGNIYYKETPEVMAPFVPQLVKAGASLIGGCCGTTPEHIKLFRKEIDKILGK